MARCEDCIHQECCVMFAGVRTLLCGDKADERCKLFKPTADATPKSEWISVDERLPTDRELVLVSSMDLLTKKHGWFYLARYTDLQNDGVIFDNKRWLSENGGIFGKVTHWMPLPEPPITDKPTQE